MFVKNDFVYKLRLCSWQTAWNHEMQTKHPVFETPELFETTNAHRIVEQNTPCASVLSAQHPVMVFVAIANASNFLNLPRFCPIPDFLLYEFSNSKSHLHAALQQDFTSTTTRTSHMLGVRLLARHNIVPLCPLRKPSKTFHLLFMCNRKLYVSLTWKLGWWFTTCFEWVSIIKPGSFLRNCIGFIESNISNSFSLERQLTMTFGILCHSFQTTASCARPDERFLCHRVLTVAWNCRKCQQHSDAYFPN